MKTKHTAMYALIVVAVIVIILIAFGLFYYYGQPSVSFR